jgi:hypothetical protein
MIYSALCYYMPMPPAKVRDKNNINCHKRDWNQCFGTKRRSALQAGWITNDLQRKSKKKNYFIYIKSSRDLGSMAGVRFPVGSKWFSFLNSISTGSGVHHSIQRVPRALSLGVKWQRRETDQSPPPSVEVKNGGATPPLPHTSLWRGVSFIKYRLKITFYLLLTYNQVK